MNKIVLIWIASFLLTGCALISPPKSDGQPALIKKIVVTGFMLHDKSMYQKLNKENHHKRLSSSEISNIIEQLRAVYRREGYIGLVEITPRTQRGVLTLHVSLSKQ